jgi:hypothetical protein
MDPEPEIEDVLRDGFAEVRGRREDAAGGFEATVAAGRARARTRRAQSRRRAVVALATATPVAVAVALHLDARAEERRALAVATEAAAIAEWRPATEPLLSSAYTVWMQHPSPLQASVLDPYTNPSGGSQ